MSPEDWVKNKKENDAAEPSAGSSDPRGEEKDMSSAPCQSAEEREPELSDGMGSAGQTVGPDGLLADPKFESRRKFIVNFIYLVIIFGLSVLFVRYALPALVSFIIAFLVTIVLRPVLRFFTDKCGFNRRTMSLILVLLFYATIGVAAFFLFASIVNWNPVNIGIVENNLGVVKQHGGDDEAVTDLVCKYLEKNDPTFLFVHFDGCDGAGHRFGYGTEKHLNQIHITDGYIQRIYEALEKRGFADSTLFLVTADHGGTNNDGKSGSHGGWTDAEKYIMFAATGPGVEKGEIQDMGVRDTASVVLYGLGLIDKQPETWTSRVPSGLFKGVTAKERPVYTIKYAFEHRTHETAPTPTGDASVVAKLGKKIHQHHEKREK